MLKIQTIITESSLTRVWQHAQSDRPFAILTAFRGEFDSETNIRRNKALAGDLKNAGFGYFYLDGYWVENKGKPEEKHVSEDSIFAIGAVGQDDKFEQTVIALGNEYNQEGLLIKSHGEVKALNLGTGDFEVVNNFSAGSAGEVYSKLRNNKKSNTFVFESERDGAGFGWHIANKENN